MVNPAELAIFGNPRRRTTRRRRTRVRARRRSVRASGQHRPRVRVKGRTFILGAKSPYKGEVARVNRPRRRKRVVGMRRRRRSYRRNSFALNPRRRRTHVRRRRHVARRGYRRNPALPFGLDAVLSIEGVVGGVGAALVHGWGVPYLATTMSKEPGDLWAGMVTGWTRHAWRAGLGIVGGYGLPMLGVPRKYARSFATFSVVIAIYGAIADQLQGFAVTPQPLGRPLGYYEQGGDGGSYPLSLSSGVGSDYDATGQGYSAYGSAVPGMSGYYTAV